MILFVRPTITTVPMRIEKNSTTQRLTNAVWTKIVGWVVSSGYGSTIIVNDSISVTSSGTYSILANDDRDGGSHSTTAARILVNGSVVATSASGNDPAVVSIASINLNEGDLVTLEGYTNTVGSTTRDTVPITTFIQILPV